MNPSLITRPLFALLAVAAVDLSAATPAPDFAALTAAAHAANTTTEPMAPGPFAPTWDSLKTYETPEWFRDAKFGIWAHWGPQCQPEMGDWYARKIYQPASINHHDNLDLWDSRYQPWNSTVVGPKKDLIDGWAKAARAQGLSPLSRPSMKRRPLILTSLLVVAGGFVASAAELENHAPPDSFEERRKATLEAFAEHGTEKFMQAECLFALGRPQEALREVNKGLDALVPGNGINRWMHGGNTGFIAWPGIDCYIRYEKLLDEATRQRYREIYTGGVFYAKLSTSNHKMMAALTRYLATQVWGPDAFHADPFFMEKDPYIIEMTNKANNAPPGCVWGTLFNKGDATGEKYLREIIKSTVRGGPGEFASRPYGAQNVLPLLSLADCAKDPAMAAQARIAYEVCLIEIAPAWLRGHLATFAPRSYPDTESQEPWGFATLPWLYFGGVPPKLSGAKAAAAAAVSSYRVPELIVNAATDRSAPYFYRARINGWALNHYVARNYALFSRSAKIGGNPWQGQSYPCGVMWEEPDVRSKGSHLWITTPSSDEPDKMGNHTHGVRAYEQEVLGRDSLLFAVQMPHDVTFPYALGYVPGGHRAFINDAAATGRIFLHYGSVLIAVTASEPFQWDPSSGIRAPASKPRAGDSEFRVKSRSCALAIETATPSEFPGENPAAQLAGFRRSIIAKSSLKSTAGTPVSSEYRSRFGETLECTFDGPDKVNGEAVDYKAWPVSESPWTTQKQPDGLLEVHDGKTSRSYDFINWKINDRDQ